MCTSYVLIPRFWTKNHSDTCTIGANLPSCLSRLTFYSWRYILKSRARTHLLARARVFYATSFNDHLFYFSHFSHEPVHATIGTLMHTDRFLWEVDQVVQVWEHFLQSRLENFRCKRKIAAKTQKDGRRGHLKYRSFNR